MGSLLSNSPTNKEPVIIKPKNVERSLLRGAEGTYLTKNGWTYDNDCSDWFAPEDENLEFEVSHEDALRIQKNRDDL
jgi:hypothetical protein